jgi:hypothetical protein
VLKFRIERENNETKNRPGLSVYIISTLEIFAIFLIMLDV